MAVHWPFSRLAGRAVFVVVVALWCAAQQQQNSSSPAQSRDAQKIQSGSVPDTSGSSATNSEKPAAQPSTPSPPASSAQTNSQASPPSDQASTTITVTTRMVLVDVVVTDGKARPVTDLKVPDFQVRENGRPQKVVAFSLRQPPPSSETAKQLVLPPGVYTNLRNLEGTTGPPTVLLIDALNTPTKDQMYLRQQLVKYLEKIEPWRNVAIYTLGTRLRMLQDFTSDPDLLHEALKKVTAQSSMFNAEPQDSDDTFAGLDPDSADQSTAEMAQMLHEFTAEQQAYQRDFQVRMTLEAMQELARNVAGYAGRKNLVWLSGSFPLTVFPDETSSNSFAVQRQYGDDLRKTAALFAANEIAVYPVDAHGLVGSFLPDASQRVPSLAGPRAGQNAGRMIQQRSVTLITSHDTMNELASQTGGHAFYNRNDIDHAIALSVAEGSTYYTLGYYPDDKNLDGRFRRIEVKVDRKGVQTHYRKGYFAVDPKPVDEKIARNEFYSALEPEEPLSTAIPFIVRITPPGKDQKAVALDFSILPTAVTFQTQGELRHAKVEIVIRVFDLRGKPTGTPRGDSVEANLKIPTYNEVLKRGLRLHKTIDLAPGKYVLKMGVRDELSNQIGTLVAKVNIP